ncbi:hypothetical protein HPB49_024808 [Dermacentor silvarum]|uniref:Uncharacterized protein n=1 Tax=Dermacentor silvarum TaxID=543639 RepID=A0ACB8E3V5_DERSI|nr:hypothetical protein HPB49_024808 [Dermacentor silvarum]
MSPLRRKPGNPTFEKLPVWSSGRVTRVGSTTGSEERAQPCPSPKRGLTIDQSGHVAVPSFASSRPPPQESAALSRHWPASKNAEINVGTEEAIATDHSTSYALATETWD